MFFSPNELKEKKKRCLLPEEKFWKVIFFYLPLSHSIFFSYMSNLLLVLRSVHAFHRVFFLAG